MWLLMPHGTIVWFVVQSRYSLGMMLDAHVDKHFADWLLSLDW
jgi:hypothetical protein